MSIKDSASKVEIASEGKVEDVKPWELPFWNQAGQRREPPKDYHENNFSKESETEATVEDIEVDDETLKPKEKVVEEEVSPQAEEHELPTVDEIEKIREQAHQEGFNAGKNQGYQEGLELGKKEGYEQGHQEGQEHGETEGKRVGFETGKAEGSATGMQEVVAASQHLKQIADQLRLACDEKDQQLPHVISQLIRSSVEMILQRELQDGDSTILQKVQRALEQLPAGSKDIKIYISAIDAEYFEQGLERINESLEYIIDDDLGVGSCRVETENTLIEYMQEERMQQVLEHVEQSFLGIDNTESNAETENTDNVANTDTIESTENTENIEGIESTENSENLESVDNTERIEASEQPDVSELEASETQEEQVDTQPNEIDTPIDDVPHQPPSQPSQAQAGHIDDLFGDSPE